jgi:hypothetical protein
MTKAITARIGMTLDNRYPARHGWMSSLDGVSNHRGLPKSAARALIGVNPVRVA